MNEQKLTNYGDPRTISIKFCAIFISDFGLMMKTTNG